MKCYLNIENYCIKLLHVITNCFYLKLVSKIRKKKKNKKKTKKNKKTKKLYIKSLRVCLDTAYFAETKKLLKLVEIYRWVHD